MSTNLTTATTKNDDTPAVHVASFSGGNRGQMIQLHQMGNGTADVIHADEEQVADLVHTLQMWLNR